MRQFFFIIAVIILALFAGGYYVKDHANVLLAKMISKKMRVPVSIEEVAISKDKIYIKNLEIKNPEEAQLKTALRVNEIKIQASWFNYFKSPIVLDEIQLHNIYVSIEFYNKDKTKGNWVTLMNNLNKENFSYFSLQRTALIRQLILTDISIDLLLASGSVNKLSPISQLEFHNISSEKGIPTQEITEIIIQKMMEQIFIIKGIKAIFIDIPRDVVETIFAPFKFLFDPSSKKKSSAPQESNK